MTDPAAPLPHINVWMHDVVEGVFMRHIRVNITLTPGDLRRLDELAARTGKSRSQLIRDAVRAYRPDPVPEAVERPDRETLAEWLRTVRIRLPADSTAMIRAMREGRREW